LFIPLIFLLVIGDLIIGHVICISILISYFVECFDGVISVDFAFMIAASCEMPSYNGTSKMEAARWSCGSGGTFGCWNIKLWCYNCQ
jgi:hypothetical protein